MDFVDTFGDFSHTVEWNSVVKISTQCINLYYTVLQYCIVQINTLWQFLPYYIVITTLHTGSLSQYV